MEKLANKHHVPEILEVEAESPAGFDDKEDALGAAADAVAVVGIGEVTEVSGVGPHRGGGEV